MHTNIFGRGVQEARKVNTMQWSNEWINELAIKTTKVCCTHCTFGSSYELYHAHLCCFVTQEALLPQRDRATRLCQHHAVALCLCLSQVGVLSKSLNESSWFLTRELPSTYPTLYSQEIRVSPKIRALPSGTSPKTLDLENFATASQWCGQQNSSTVELVDHTYDNRRVVAGHT